MVGSVGLWELSCIVFFLARAAAAAGAGWHNCGGDCGGNDDDVDDNMAGCEEYDDYCRYGIMAHYCHGAFRIRDMGGFCKVRFAI